MAKKMIKVMGICVQFLSIKNKTREIIAKRILIEKIEVNLFFITAF